jgi:hypothetical protein
MAGVAAECRARGCQTLLLTAGTDKNKARATYARIGFQPTGFFIDGAAVLSADIQDVENGIKKRLKGRF